MDLTSSELYRNTIANLEKAGRLINLSPAAFERLKTPKRAIMVGIPVRMDDDSVQIFEGYRVQHSQILGPFKGGIRYHPSVHLSEVAALASLMTFKNSLLGLPLGGGKGGVKVDPTRLSKRENEALTRRFTTELGPFIGPDKDIPAPDVGTDSQTMAWMMDTFSLDRGFPSLGVVTGKPVEIGGSHGRDSSTGLGVVFITLKALQSQGIGIQEASIAIQGFGKVGMHAAIEASKLGAKIVAVSDVSGGIFNGDGLNISEVCRYIAENRVLKGYPDAKHITNEELLELPVDVLAPCAMENVITEMNANRIRAKIIVEGANGPVTPSATEVLVGKGSMIVPDILANGGGVVVSYFEWLQDISWFFWTEDQVRDKLKQIMDRSFERVHEYAKDHKKDMRMSAMAVSLLRLERAMRLRGQV